MRLLCNAAGQRNFERPLSVGRGQRPLLWVPCAAQAVAGFDSLRHLLPRGRGLRGGRAALLAAPVPRAARLAAQPVVQHAAATAAPAAVLALLAGAVWAALAARGSAALPAAFELAVVVVAAAGPLAACVAARPADGGALVECVAAQVLTEQRAQAPSGLAHSAPWVALGTVNQTPIARHALARAAQLRHWTAPARVQRG